MKPEPIDVGASAEVLRRLELTITRRLDGLLHGDHRGLVPGHGSEPGEARVYQPGDDVRRIDWNVTARTQALHVRETIADRELDTWLLVDLSASLEFGTALTTKRSLALAAAAAVGFLTARGGNRLGAVLATGGEEPATILPAKGGRDHLRAVLHRIMTAEIVDGNGPTDLPAALLRLDRSMRRRGLAVVISDWIDDDPMAATPAFTHPLRRLGVRNDVLCVEVVDPRELSLPDVGVLEVVDPETGRSREVQTGDSRLRARYAQAAAARRDALAMTFRSAGADHLELSTDRDWLRDLVTFVSTRRDRAAAVARSTGIGVHG
jgi:uncharacterized protein (DUF58 family)